MGDLCLSGDIGRYAGDVRSSGDLGAFSLDIDLTAIPRPTGTAAALAGESWYFQCWHRDAVGGTATSNFSPAIRVDLD